MEITAEALVLVGVICIVLGFLASMLLGTLKDDVVEPAPGVAEAPPGGQKGRYSPVARLWRERDTERLVVEVDGRSLVSTEPLRDGERVRLEQAARDLHAWLGMGLAEAPRPGPAQEAAAEPGPLAGSDWPPEKSGPAMSPPPPSPADNSGARSPEDALRRAWAAAIPEPEPEEMPAPQPRDTGPLPRNTGPLSRNTGPLPRNTGPLPRNTGPLPRNTGPLPRNTGPLPAEPYAVSRGARPVVLPDEPAPLPSSAGKSIVLQIEDILQDMLYGSPLRSRGIHLSEDPARGVVVSLDGKYYDGIDAVPDPEAKAFIRSAVAAWEKSQ